MKRSLPVVLAAGRVVLGYDARLNPSLVKCRRDNCAANVAPVFSR